MLDYLAQSDANTNAVVLWVQNYWTQHGVVGLMAAWLVLSSAINAMLALKPAEFWIDFAQSNPKGAALIRMIRAAGIDPVAALKALQVYFDEKKKKDSEKKDSASEKAP